MLIDWFRSVFLGRFWDLLSKILLHISAQICMAPLLGRHQNIALDQTSEEGFLNGAVSILLVIHAP